MRRSCLLCCAWLLLLLPVGAQTKAVTAETARLLFQVAPLTTNGDVAAQVRQQMKSFTAPLAHLRAFVAGTDRLVAARTAIEAELKQRKAAPALTIVAVGALPRGVLVALEAVTLANKSVNPHGLAFISGQAGSADTPVAQMLPLAEKAMRDLNAVHQAAGVVANDVLRVTCLATSLQDVNAVEKLVRATFPQAATSIVQLQRAPARGVIECETVARLRAAVSEPLKFAFAESLPKSPNFSHVALVGAKQVVFSGAHVAGSLEDAEARKTYEELTQTLASAGASIKQVAMSSIFPVSQAAADLVRKTRFNFYDPARPPASTMMIFEGIAANAAFAVDVIAVKVDK
ncbi:MAG TPA: RidA family protein [Blastocatellia bacterium]|nr:RidA family protein [Blastocatellia bacterium]